MNRIKIRIWNQIDRVFFYVVVGKDKINAFDPNVYEATLFTGVSDKNGKEIYGGDIIKRKWDGLIFEVVFKNGCFECGQRTNDIFEIVGNIYESPELLENKQHEN